VIELGLGEWGPTAVRQVSANKVGREPVLDTTELCDILMMDAFVVVRPGASFPDTCSHGAHPLVLVLLVNAL
jgi:hypothetical protein